MEQIIVALSFAFSLSAFACQCDYGDRPLKETTTLVKNLIHRTIGEDVQIETNRWGDHVTKWIKAYPYLMDRLVAPSERGTSCETRGPNDEPLMACPSRMKGDYEYSLILASGEKCSAVIQETVSTTKATAKLLSTNCK